MMTKNAAGLVIAAGLCWGIAPAATDSVSADGNAMAKFELTIRNTNQGQNFSRPAILLHDPNFSLFRLGEAASRPLWLLAEEGQSQDFVALGRQDPRVFQVLLGGPVHRRKSPVITLHFESPDDALLSAAAMLTLTNDGFVAAGPLSLPQEPGASVNADLHAFDAGSEANSESCERVPCEVHGVRLTEGAEGVVSEHRGIRGDRDIPSRRDWSDSVLGTVTITRLP